MNKTETELKERIKELTCLYEVSSIILKALPEQTNETLLKISKSLKKAFHEPDKVEVSIVCSKENVSTTQVGITPWSIQSDIILFRELKGTITVFYKESENANFLKEEQDLLDNIGVKVGIFLEKIERTKNEISLKQQMERADRLVILGELTAGIAHELNTPLTNILGFAELLKEDLRSNESALIDLEKIMQNTIFSREVVKKLMFFACEMPQEMKQVNLVPIIKEAIDLLDSTFRKNEVKYIVKIEMEEIILSADPIQLTQIVFNLAINSIYFSPKNGLVIISVTQSKETVFLEICDEGKGLNKEEMEKIFHPFYSTKPVGEGTGLGLSVVHGIVKAHKGTISVVNNLKKGVCFKIVLPK